MFKKAICVLESKYAAAFKELEEARETLGYHVNKLSILRFPRRVRDQIFIYALEAPLPVRTHPLPYIYTNVSKFKPNLLRLVGSQVYREAKRILYSRTTFALSGPQHMLEFFGSNRRRKQGPHPVNIFRGWLYTEAARVELSLTTGQTL